MENINLSKNLIFSFSQYRDSLALGTALLNCLFFMICNINIQRKIQRSILFISCFQCSNTIVFCKCWHHITYKAFIQLALYWSYVDSRHETYQEQSNKESLLPLGFLSCFGKMLVVGCRTEWLEAWGWSLCLSSDHFFSPSHSQAPTPSTTPPHHTTPHHTSAGST